MTLHVRTVAVVASVPIGILLGVAAYGLASSFQSEEYAGDPTQDPCYEKSDDECEALIQESEADFWAQMETWLAEINAKDLDIGSLPTAEMNGDYALPPETNLSDASARADAIVIGKVADVTFLPRWETQVQLVIETALKGELSGEIVVTQPGGPEPYPDWESMRLATAPANPLLLPGERAFLLLEYDDAAETFYVLPWTGQYQIDHEGLVSPLDTNPFASSVDGLTESEMTASVEAATAQQ
jgi:hypothetical protein